MADTRGGSLVEGSKLFPFPTAITRAEFQNFDVGRIDAFLCNNHRFESLDHLIRELETLSKELKNELLELVNREYSGFVKLGKSINGGVNIVDTMREDLNSFRKNLVQTKKNLTQSSQYVAEKLAERHQVSQIRELVKLVLVVDELLKGFERLISSDGTEPKLLISLYLSISKQYNFISHELQDYEIIKHLGNRVKSARLELSLFLDSCLSVRLAQGKNAEIFELQRMYDLLGFRANFIALLNEKKK